MLTPWALVILLLFTLMLYTRLYNTTRHCQVELFPSFQTKNELETSKWAEYIDYVYGIDTIGDNDFPFQLHRFNFFYRHKLPQDVRACLASQMGVKLTPERYMDVYSTQNWGAKGYTPSQELWVYQYPYAAQPVYVGGYLTRKFSMDVLNSYPFFEHYHGFPSHSKVEVMHYNISGEYMSMWFYLAKGSGVYMNLGKTVVKQTHYDVFRMFDVEYETKSEGWKKVLPLLRTANYNTVQITHHSEGFFKYEIVSVDTLPTRHADGCFPANVAASFFSGYNGLEPCICHPRLSRRINCQSKTEF